jgi:two-component system, NtrC family, C4-dicarboxylate transport sensor histidine kinase DctB
MPTYIKDTKEHFEKLSHAVEIGDCAAIAAYAHALKGVGRNLSIEQLSDLAYQMERAGRENDIEASTLLFNSLKMEIEKVMMVLSKCDWIEKAKMV